MRLLEPDAVRPLEAVTSVSSFQWQGQVLPFWPFKPGFKVTSGTASWYRSSSGTDFDNSEIASPEGSRLVNAGSF